MRVELHNIYGLCPSPALPELGRVREEIKKRGGRLNCELGYLAWMVERRLSGGAPEDEIPAWQIVQQKYRIRASKGLSAIEPVE